MHIRRFFAICSLILIGGIMVACGSDDEDASPTATIAPTEAATTAAVEPPGTEGADLATPAGTPIATPVSEEATPVGEEATPAPDVVVPPPVVEDDESTPVLDAPDSTPVIEEDESTPVLAAPDSTPVFATPESTPVPMVDIAGTLTLDGRIQQDYTLTEEGCVGLGEWRQLKAGTQVIVRNATGTVVDIAELEEQDSGEECAWTFAIQAPGADFFSVSIPLVTEVWFDQNDPAVQSGEVELFVP